MEKAAKLARTSAQGSTSDMVSPMPRQTPRRLIAVASAGVGPPGRRVSTRTSRPDRPRRVHAAGARPARRQLEKTAAVRARRARNDRRARAGAAALVGRAARLHLVHPRRLLRPESRQGQRRDDRRRRAPQLRGRLSEAPAGARKTRTARDDRGRPVGRSSSNRRIAIRCRPMACRPASTACSSRRGSRNSFRRRISCASSSRKASTRSSAAKRSTAATCCRSSTTPRGCLAAPIAAGRKRGASEQDQAYDAEFKRLMNKVALVTLWVEPKAHQIVKYTFNNLPFDFLPGQWLLHVDDLRASMTMGQPFPDVWLPSDLEFEFGISLAVGQVDMRYALDVPRLPPTRRHHQSQDPLTMWAALFLLLVGGPEGPALHTAPVAAAWQGRETVAAIQVHGNTITKDDELRRLAGIEIGAVVDANTVDEVAARLRTRETVRRRPGPEAVRVDRGPVADSAGDHRRRRSRPHRTDRRRGEPDPRRPQPSAGADGHAGADPRRRLRIHLRRAPGTPDGCGPKQPPLLPVDVGR